ncbi:YlxR family protein [Gulosibacter bifidus]|uniref:YlxR family protein n=1 Tax=Gulosibacter bifidus TaxID=272239 RepID=A0ABW5RHB9_9MICO|nr:YlxR family protein [Gulosibacter bifidus]
MEPVRTCIGCRSRAEKSQLIRVAVQDSQVIIDRAGVLPGRGAWLHPSVACVEQALERKQFRRAFRRAVSDDTEVREYLKHIREKVVDRTMDQS